MFDSKIAPKHLLTAPNPKLLPKLLKLLDAESKQVRQQVMDELLRFGSNLPHLLTQSELEMTPEQLYEWELARQGVAGSQLREFWLDWLFLPSLADQLEVGLSNLVTLQMKRTPRPSLSAHLNELAAEYLRLDNEVNVLALNQFLFQSGRFTGEKDNYYAPMNSNLCHVLETGKGLPISLACIYILLAARLGLDVHGFNLPGHFMVMTLHKGRMLFIDCFDHGRVYDTHDVAQFEWAKQSDFATLLGTPCLPFQIVARFIRNMIHAYWHRGDAQMEAMMKSLLDELMSYQDIYYQHLQDHPDDMEPDELAGLGEVTNAELYEAGMLIKHRRYGYRGVIVAADSQCAAPDEWYQSNRTQPDRNQPWYHVLVDGSKHATYAAQSNLEPDLSGREIQHPLMARFFEGFHRGRYIRNQNVWPYDGEG